MLKRNEDERPLTPNEELLKQWEANNSLYKVCMFHSDILPDWVKNIVIKEEINEV